MPQYSQLFTSQACLNWSLACLHMCCCFLSLPHLSCLTWSLPGPFPLLHAWTLTYTLLLLNFDLIKTFRQWNLHFSPNFTAFHNQLQMLWFIIRTTLWLIVGMLLPFILPPYSPSNPLPWFKPMLAFSAGKQKDYSNHRRFLGCLETHFTCIVSFPQAVPTTAMLECTVWLVYQWAFWFIKSRNWFLVLYPQSFP